jgi:hypothetical protein
MQERVGRINNPVAVEDSPRDRANEVQFVGVGREPLPIVDLELLDHPLLPLGFLGLWRVAKPPSDWHRIGESVPPGDPRGDREHERRVKAARKADQTRSRPDCVLHESLKRCERAQLRRGKRRLWLKAENVTGSDLKRFQPLGPRTCRPVLLTRAL